VTDPSGNKQAVTLVRIINPATPGQVNTLTAGNQLVGVELKVTNTGSTTFYPNPANATTVIDSQGHGYRVDISDITGCPAVQNLMPLAPGKRMDGCIAFQVPAGTTVAKVQYQPLSAGTSESLEWQVP